MIDWLMVVIVDGNCVVGRMEAFPWSRRCEKLVDFSRWRASRHFYVEIYVAPVLRKPVVSQSRGLRRNAESKILLRPPSEKADAAPRDDDDNDGRDDGPSKSIAP